MKHSNWKIKILSVIALGLMLLGSFAPRSVSGATTIQSTDFQQQSFSKVTDWFDYVRQYAAANGLPAPNSSEHAYLYTNYINVNGFQLFYVGLVNATHLGRYVTIPLQTFFEHYKTPAGKTVITATSFISLVSFQENASTIFPNSPDRNDTIYASFSLGVNLTSTFGGRPVPPYVASSEVIPLTSSNNNLHWTWGLRYTNLNAIWWKIGVDPVYPFWNSSTPRGLARYSELTFNYDLTIDPTMKTAKLTTSYTIGRVTDLWILSSTPVLHLNSTGTYDLNGARLSTVTVYDALRTNGYKLSIVLANKAIVASHTTTDKDDTRNSVDDTERDITHSNVNTTATDDGERVFSASFGAKSTYNLYDTSDSNPVQYDVTTRTVRRYAWGGNPVFAFQNRFMGFLPLFVAHVDPALFQQAQAGMVSFAVANYLYVIAYPQWGGTRIVHDPDFTAFYQPASNAGLLTSLFIAVAVAAAVGGVIAFLLRRRKTANVALGGATGPAPPGQGPIPTGPPSPGR